MTSGNGFGANEEQCFASFRFIVKPSSGKTRLMNKQWTTNNACFYRSTTSLDRTLPTYCLAEWRPRPPSMELCVVSMELWARHMDRHCVVDKIVTFWGAEFPFFSGWDTPHKLEEAPSLVTGTMPRQPQLWIRRGVGRYCSDQVFVCFGWMELGGDGTIFRDGKKGVCLLIKSWVSLPLLAPSSIAQDPSVPSSSDCRLNIIKDRRVQQRVEFSNFYINVHGYTE